mmetsp:Transcript_55927/g.77093  ORF Transcript_55927/g.77093 Transcript_55927/m.77093 type:complete len:243 (+) Transcript_55927:410-1138(+)
MKMTKRSLSSRVPSLTPLLLTSLTLPGMMLPVWRQPRNPLRRPSSCPLSSLSSSRVSVNHGEVSCCTDPPVLVSLSWLKLALLNAMVHSSQSVHLISSVNGWVSQKSSSSSCLRWPVIRSHLLFSLMRSILSAVAEVKVKTTPLEESKLNSLFKCKVSVMTWMESLSLVLLTYHGNLIMLLEEDLRRESTSLSLRPTPVQSVSSLRLVIHLTIAQNRTGRFLVRPLKAILVLIAEQLSRKPS